MIALAGLLKSSNTQAPPSSRARRPASLSEDLVLLPSSDTYLSQDSPTYIVEKEQIKPTESDDPDLRLLNNSLAALAAIFPDVQIEVFREMLSSFDEESRLAVVTETLLRHKMKWARGRYRVIGKEITTRAENHKDNEGVPVKEKFRSTRYQKAVKVITYHEFKGLSRSTINAVLAEQNYSYSLSRPNLIALSSKSWRFSLSSIFLRKKQKSSPDAEQHPLVVWQSTAYGSLIPSLKATGCPELDMELFESLIIPIQKRCISERETNDHALALEINNEQAEENDALHDCECCFTATAFEALSACNEGGHFVCYRCIQRAISEAVFGQGWSRNIDIQTGSLRCLAAMADDCQGCIPQELIRRAIHEENGGEDVLRKLDERLVEDSLLKAQLPLIRCPFCSYAEIDELYLPESPRTWYLKHGAQYSLQSTIFLILGVGIIPFLLLLFCVLSLMSFLLSSQQTFGDYVLDQFKASINRTRRRRHGLKFTCQNPDCRRPSCLSCLKVWSDIHICHESSLLALRTQVELAMSLAIKRTCPRCNTSFVKSSGCNKLTCVCGYQMCYVCRKDIGNGEGYRHFCEHFRPNGGRGCTECSKCDLYRCEDEDAVVKSAKEEAERQWMEKEGSSLETSEDIRKVLVERYQPGKDYWWCHSRLPKWESVFDALVESVIE